MGLNPIKSPDVCKQVFDNFAETKGHVAHYPRDFSWNSKHTH